MEVIVVIVSVILILIGAVIVFLGYKRSHSYMLIKSTPRSKIGTLPMGLVEIHGNVMAKETLKTPFTKTDCVYYRYEVREYRKHTSTDSDGKKTTEYTWDKIDTGEQRVPFFAEDETGNVYVNPRKAEFNVTKKKELYQKADLVASFPTVIDTLMNLDDKESVISNVADLGLTFIDSDRKLGPSRGDRKFIEYYLEPGDDLFMIGTAAHSRYVPNNIVVRKGWKEPTFIISNRSEMELMGVMRWQIAIILLLGGFPLILGIVFLYYGMVV